MLDNTTRQKTQITQIRHVGHHHALAITNNVVVQHVLFTLFVFAGA
jgi:hypothetical protein